MTYNIRLDIDSDGPNKWENRKEILTTQIFNLNADIIGTQEGRPNQIEFLQEQLVGFDKIGNGRDGGNQGEHTAIFYRTNRFEVLQDSTFWLSDTPKEYSLGWDSAYPRICTYGLFRDKKNNTKFWLANTHLDNKGVVARQKGMDLIITTLESLNKNQYPIILMGDFNVEPTTTLIKDLSSKMIDTHVTSKNAKLSGTFNAFDPNLNHDRRIDYIFISKEKIQALSYDQPILINNGKYPSDHFPVISEIAIN